MGVPMGKQIGAGESVVDKKGTGKEMQGVGTVMKTRCTERETREGDGKVNGKGKA